MENNSDDQKSIRSTGKVSLGTLCSRILGLVREQVFAYLFGAGMAADAFIAAFRIPNLLRDMFAEGSLSAAFIPTFTEKLAKEGKSEAFRVAQIVLTFLLIVVSLVVAAGMLFAPEIVNQIAGGYQDVEGKIALTTSLARIMMPFLLLVSMAALLMGILNSLGLFGVPAFAPMLLNIGMIVAGFLICPFFDPPIIGMAIGVILGGAGQFLFQLPAVLKHGFRFKLSLNFKDSAFLKIIGLMIPMAIGFSATQINVFVVTRIAASMAEGSVAYLNYAFRLMHLPLGMFALAIATVSLPQISRYAALDDKPKMAEAFRRSLKLGLFLVIPAEVVLIFGGKIIISALFQHGSFSADDTVSAASALTYYSIGLLAFAAVRITVPVFYAFKETAKPIMVSLVSVALNIFLCYTFKESLGFRGLALAASISGFLNIIILLILLKFRLPQINLSGQLWPFLKILCANLILGLGIYLFSAYIAADITTYGLHLRLLYLLILLVGGAAVYLLISRLLNIEQLSGLREIFRRIK
jgi:putative peptidoglycan lipid II flippase